MDGVGNRTCTVPYSSDVFILFYSLNELLYYFEFPILISSYFMLRSITIPVADTPGIV